MISEIDEATAKKLEDLLASALLATEAIPVPFDYAISSSASAEDRNKVKIAVDALQDAGDQIVVAARKLNITISTDLPE